MMLKQRYNYWFIVLFAITVCGTSLYAQPKIVVQDTINWGAVSPDTILDDLEPTVYYSIPIYNKGTEPLIISEVKPSCGCTAAPIDKNVVPPGDSTYMHVGLKLPNQNGELHKLISIFSNDKSDSVKVVNLFAVVERPLQLSSSFIPFNKGSVGDTIRGQIQLTVFGKSPITFKIQSPGSHTRLYSPSEFTIQPGGSGMIDVGYYADKPGAFSCQVVVNTDHKEYPHLDLWGYGFADPQK